MKGLTQMTQPLYRCSTCQSSKDAPDDHPKVHYGEDRYHYDCLPAVVKEDILGPMDTARTQALAKVIGHAEGTGRPKHLHGADLRDKVAEVFTAVNTQEAAAAEKENSDG